MHHSIDGSGLRPQHGGYVPLPLPQPGAAMREAADGGGSGDCGGGAGVGPLCLSEGRFATELPDPDHSPGRQRRHLDSRKERTPGRVRGQGYGQAVGLGGGGSSHQEVEPRQADVPGNDDAVLPAANPFLRFVGTPPSAGKLRGLGPTAAPARSPLGPRQGIQQQQQQLQQHASNVPESRESHQQQTQQQQQHPVQPEIFPLAMVRAAETAPVHGQGELGQQQQPALAYCASAALGAYRLPQTGCGHFHEARSAPVGPFAQPEGNPAALQPRSDSSMPRAAGPGRPDGPTNSAPPHAAQPDQHRQHTVLPQVQQGGTQLRQDGGSGPQADPHRHDSQHITTRPGKSALLESKAWTGPSQSNRGPTFAERALSAAPSQPRPAPRPAWPPRAAGERGMGPPAAADGNGTSHNGHIVPWEQGQRHDVRQHDWCNGRQPCQQATQVQSSAVPLDVPPQQSVQGASQAPGPYPAAAWGGGHAAQQQLMNRTQQLHHVNGPSEQPLMAPKGPVREAGPGAALHGGARTAGAVSGVSWDAPGPCAKGSGPCWQEPADGPHQRAPCSLPMADARMGPAPVSRSQEQPQGQHQQHQQLQQQRLNHQHQQHRYDYQQQHSQQGHQQQQNAPQQPWQAWPPLCNPSQGQPPSQYTSVGQGRGAQPRHFTGLEQPHLSVRHLSYPAAQHSANYYQQHQQPWQLQPEGLARPHVQQQLLLQPSLHQPQQQPQQAQQRAAGHPPQPQTMRLNMPETRSAHRLAVVFPGEYRGRCPYDRCPGVFQPCNAELLWVRPHPSALAAHSAAPASVPEPTGYWRCSRSPECGYRYYPHPRLKDPVLACEVVGDAVFKVVSFPGAEDAVTAAGGVACVLAGAGANLQAALTAVEARRMLAEGAAAAGLPSSGSSGGRGRGADGGAGGEGGGGARPIGNRGACGPSKDDGPADAGATASNVCGATAVRRPASPPMELELEDGALYFPLSSYESLLAPLPPHCPLFHVGSLIPEPVRRTYRGCFKSRAPPAEVSSRLSRLLPPSLGAALLPFQREGVVFGLERHGRVLIADEMGVGKTVQAIALAACYEDEWPLLCIVPASLRLVWAEELEKWLPHLRPSHLHVIEGKADRLTGRVSRGESLPRVTITSYEMMRRLTCPACSKTKLAPPPPQQQQEAAPVAGDKAAEAHAPRHCGRHHTAPGEAQVGGRGAGGASSRTAAKAACWGPDRCMAAMGWGVVIVDESHNLRTTNSRDADSPHTEACCAAVSRARRAVLLSGTPSLSRPYDLYRQVDALVPGLVGGSKQAFAFRYCDGRMVPQRVPYSHAGQAGGPRPFRGGVGTGPGGEGVLRKRLETSGGSRLSELHGLLRREVMVRRLKRDVVAQLPPKRRQVVRLPHPKSWPDADRKNPGDTNTIAGAKASGGTVSGTRDGAAPGSTGDGTWQRSDSAADGRSARGSWHRAGRGRGRGPGRSVKRAKGDGAAAAAAEDASDSGEDGGGDARRGDPEDEEGQGDTGSEDEGQAGRAAEGFAPTADGGAKVGVMSSAHRTALAKLPDAIAWLVGALGGAGIGGSGGGGSQEGTSSGRVRCRSLPATGARDAPLAHGRLQAGEEAPPKFLVFAHHRDVMDRLAEALQGFDGAEGDGEGSSGVAAVWCGVDYVRIDGSHDSAERRDAVARFRDDPSVRVALLSITAAAVGLDFSAASAVVFVELPTEVSLLQQAEDRAHRKGQVHDCVNVYFLCAKGTCDDRRWQKLNESLSAITQVHDGAEGTTAGGHGVAAGPGADGASGESVPAMDAGRLRGLAVDAVVDLEEMEPLGELPRLRAGPLQPRGPQSGAQGHGRTQLEAQQEQGGCTSGEAPQQLLGGSEPERVGGAVSGAGVGVTETAAAGSGTRVVQPIGVGVAHQEPTPQPGVLCLQQEPRSVQKGAHGQQLEGGHSRATDHRLRACYVPQAANCQAGIPNAGADSGRSAGGCDGSGASSGAGARNNLAACGMVGVEVIDLSCEPSQPDSQQQQQQQCFVDGEVGPMKPAGNQSASGRLIAAQLMSRPHFGAVPPGLTTTQAGGTPSRAALLQTLPPSTTCYFEVSAHTGRVHLHLAPDGSRPAGLSLPLELLLVGTQRSGLLKGLLQQHADRWTALRTAQGERGDEAAKADVLGGAGDSGSDAALPHGEQRAALGPTMLLGEGQPHGDGNVSVAATAACGLCGRSPGASLSFVGPLGLVALVPEVTPRALAEGVAEAEAFARDWAELRAVSRNRLYGNVLERYFQDALDAVTAEAVAAGAYGSGTARYVQDAPLRLPEGATLRPVLVRTVNPYQQRRGPEEGADGDGDGGAPAGWRTHQQAFAADGARLCLCCSKPVPDCSLPPEAPLDTTDYLFCTPACETRYYLKASGSALRRMLARLEHGVCVTCGLDCANLVRQLQAIRCSSRDYLAKRRAVAERLAPRLCRHGYTALLERLLRTATEGHAWQADHIVPVYAGGGMCDIDNMRTLCVACHADVTKAQCKQRAADRAQRKMGARDIRSFWGGAGGGDTLATQGNPTHASEGGRKRRADGQAAPPAAPQPSKARRVVTRGPAYIDSDADADSPAGTPLLAPAPCARSRITTNGPAQTDEHKPHLQTCVQAEAAAGKPPRPSTAGRRPSDQKAAASGGSAAEARADVCGAVGKGEQESSEAIAFIVVDLACEEAQGLPQGSCRATGARTPFIPGPEVLGHAPNGSITGPLNQERNTAPAVPGAGASAGGAPDAQGAAFCDLLAVRQPGDWADRLRRRVHSRGPWPAGEPSEANLRGRGSQVGVTNEAATIGGVTLGTQCQADAQGLVQMGMGEAAFEGAGGQQEAGVGGAKSPKAKQEIGQGQPGGTRDQSGAMWPQQEPAGPHVQPESRVGGRLALKKRKL